MKIVIINGSIQHDNTSQVVSKALKNKLKATETSLLTIDSFSKLFVGDYINIKNANDKQRELLTTMKNADIIFFVVPTYFKSIPGALKNFFDIIRDKQIYENKTVAVIANNYKNQDYGARHTQQVIQGLSIFHQVPIYIVPEILIVHHENIDDSELRKFIELVQNFHQNR